MPTQLNNISVRKADERGHANHGWLDSHFTFSFAGYYDPKHMGFRTLRVINDDIIEAGQGFGAHPHNDMEIISYIVEGELQHKDNMGNGSIIKQGNVQRITAGSGIEHGEFNPSKKNKTRLLQIWILPNEKGLSPSYEELNLSETKAVAPLTLIASNENKKGVVKIHQDVQLYKGNFKANEKAEYALKGNRALWLQMFKGKIDLNGVALTDGDGVSVEKEKNIQITAQTPAEFLLFDLK